MRFQKSSERRAVILMVVLSLLTLFALVGITFVLYADAEATAARIARESQTSQVADVDPETALSFFLGQLIYDVPDTPAGVASGLRGHSLARTMYGYQYPGVNVTPFNGIGRLHYASPVAYPAVAPYINNPLTNVPPNWGLSVDDFALVNYTWFSSDGFLRDPERYGVRANPGVAQANSYVGCNAPYTYPDLNNFYLAAMRADGTVLVPSYHRPWLFQVGTAASATKYYTFNDMTNPNWTNQVGKYLTLRPRPAEHPSFPLPGDPTGDVKNLPWAPGGNDSIWVDLGAPVMTAPDGTLYKMMFAPLIIDLDGRVNLNTAGNILAYAASMSAPASWAQASGAHVSNQGWGGWEVNLSKALWGDSGGWPVTTPATPPEWMRLITGASLATTTPPNTLPIIVQPGWFQPTPLPLGLSAWLLPSVHGRYLETPAGPTPLYTPNAAPPGVNFAFPSIAPTFPSAISLATTYTHPYAQADYNGWNEPSIAPPYVPSSRIAISPNPGSNPLYPFPVYTTGYANGGVPNGITNPLSVETTNNPLLFNAFQTPVSINLGTRVYRAQDMEALLRPNFSAMGPVNANASAINSDLLRLCPTNFPSDALLASMPANIQLIAQRYRNLVTTQSWDVGAPGVIPYWYSTGGVYASPYPVNQASTGYNPQLAPVSNLVAFPPILPAQPLPNVGNNPVGPPPNFSEFGLGDWRAISALSATYQALPKPVAFTNPTWAWNTNQWTLAGTVLNLNGYISPGARIRLNRPLPPYPHMGAGVTPPYQFQPPSVATPPANPFPSAYGVGYNMANAAIANQYQSALEARQALANDIYRRLMVIVGLNPPSNPATPTQLDLAPRRWLAQLAVNMVDYMDEDDISTSFNFYTIADGLVANGTTLGLTTGGDDMTPTPAANGTNLLGTNQSGANPLYWVFGTELPKVVLSEVLAEATDAKPANAAGANEKVNVWVELYNPMPKAGGTNTQPLDVNRVPLYMTSPTGGGYSPYRITIAQSTMNQLPPGATAPAAGGTNYLRDASENVLGQAYFGNGNSSNTFTPLPQSTVDSDFAAANPLPSSVPLIDGGGATQGAGIGTPNAGVDAGGFFLIGPPAPGNSYADPFVLATAANNYQGVPGLPGVPAVAPSPGLPSTKTPTLRSPNLHYQPTTTTWRANSNNDERTTGLTVMLRRLANPYLPFNPNPTIPDPNIAGNLIPNPAYNPYVTVDYVQNINIQSSNQTPTYFASRGKQQPYAAYMQTANANNASALQPTSPVVDQYMTATPPALPLGPYFVTDQNNNKWWSDFGYLNPLTPPSTHFDWLVHLDRQPISPMELLHVSAWPPYMLTQRFMRGNDNVNTASPPAAVPPNPANAVNMFGHYAPWLDFPPNPSVGMAAPWWFDTNPTPGLPNPSTLTAGQTHRLYRLFEFLECGDRAFGVNGLGRIPGKVNINTVWDPEVIQALVDGNLATMGMNTTAPSYPPNATDQVVQMFNNMMLSRSPNAGYNMATGNLTPNPQTTLTAPYSFSVGPVNMGTATATAGVSTPATFDDRPFMPLSTGLYAPALKGVGSQFPNGMSVLTDTLLRSNPAANSQLLFQNYNDPATTNPPVAPSPTTNAAVHPYLQSQVLTKLYNNVTTRSNTFAVFLTVGYFQVLTDPVSGAILPALGQANIPQLGPEIGRSEGKQIRHRMFAIVDRTNLATCSTTGQAILPGPPNAVTGATPNGFFNPASAPPYAVVNNTGVQTINLPFSAPTPNLTITGTATQLFVPNPNTMIPGVIQAGTQLVIDAGTPYEETVTVISVTPPPAAGAPASLTANFTMPHGVGGLPFSITQRGNPGPWLFTPYDPRLDTSVVQYFSIID